MVSDQSATSYRAGKLPLMLAVSLSQGKQAIYCLYQGLRATRLKVYRVALCTDQRTDTRDRDA